MADDTAATTTLISPDPGTGGDQSGASPQGAATSPGEGTQGALGAQSPPEGGKTRALEGPWIKEDGSFVADWHKHLPPDVRFEAEQQQFSRYGSVTDLARGYINSQRLIGRKGVTIPNEKSLPQEVSEYRKALGIPETTEGYEIKPDVIPEGTAWNEEDARQFKEIAHRNHIPPKAMKELVAAHVARQAEQNKRMQAAETNLLQQSFDNGMADLKASWGRDFTGNMLEVKQAAIVTGTPLDTFGFLDPAMAKMVLRLKRMVADDKFIAAGSANSSALNSVDPGKLAHAITSDKTHPEYAKYHEGDKDTQAKVEALFREAERIKERSR